MPEHTPAPTPSRAVYGFAMFLSFRLFFILYVVWAVTPEEWFKMVGITCLPQRYWAVAVPLFLFSVLIIFGFLIYPNIGLFLTPAVDDMRTIQDSVGGRKRLKIGVSTNQDKASECTCVDKSKCFKSDYERNSGDFVGKTIPALHDLNMWEVSEHLYLK